MISRFIVPRSIFAALLLLLAACAGEPATACDPSTDDTCLPSNFEYPGDASTGIDNEVPPEEPPTEPDASVPPDPVDASVPPEPVDAGEPPEPVDAGTPPEPVDAGAPPEPVDAGTPPQPDAGTPPPAGPARATPPARPSFPATIDHLSFAIRTGTGVNDGTDDNQLSLCLNATKCFPLDVKDINDRQIGRVDVYHFGNVGLPRSQVDRVELRSVNGVDAWRMACVSVQFDGEPVHCSDGLSVLLGNGNATGERQRWRDPAGVRNSCGSCYPAPLTHGPVVGVTRPESTKLWVRTDATRLVGVEWFDVASGAYRPVGYAYPRAVDDFAAKVDVAGLAPSSTHRFRVTVDGQPMATEATVRTAPPEGSRGRMKLAFGSCAKTNPQPVFDTILQEAPDLMLFVGDNHYGNTADVGGLWANYRRTLEIGRERLLAKTPTLATWDDHDYTGNNTDGTAANKANALRAFVDYWPNPSFGQTSEPGVYTTAKWGDVELFLLDSRYERSKLGTANGRMIGSGQAAWLEQKLSASTATFKLIAAGSNFSQNTGGESWLDHAASRRRLFDYIRTKRIEGVVLLSGDIHRSHFRKIRATGTGAYDLVELVSSPLANGGSSCARDPAPDATQQACVTENALFVTVETDTTLADPTLVARIVNLAGQVRATTTVRRSQLRAP